MRVSVVSLASIFLPALLLYTSAASLACVCHLFTQDAQYNYTGLGYVPAEAVDIAPTVTLEFVFDDAVLGNAAAAMNDSENEALFKSRGMFYRCVRVCARARVCVLACL